MLRVGVVGVGVMGSIHARVYYELPGVKLTCVVDRDKERAKTIANRYGAKAFFDVKDLIGKVDAVTVAVPTSLHAEVSKYLMEKGVDVLVEKPIALTLEEAREMIKVAKENDRILMVGHIERFNPIVEVLKSILKNEKIHEIETRRRNPFYSRINDCGVALDLLVHDIDVVRYITEKEPEVDYVIGGSVKSKHEDWVKVIMKYGNIPVIHMTDRRTQKKIRKIEVTCEDKLIDVDYINQEMRIFSKASVVYNDLPSFVENMEVIKSKGEPLKKEIVEFINCVKERKKPSVDGEEGKKNLEIALGVLKKMKGIGE